MFDKDTMIIAYDSGRGEPRGSRSRKTDLAQAGLGHCIDCSICVQVCPTGIDIRKGLQYECIGCAACVDGCDQVMDKMGYPKGLIRFASENSLTEGFGYREMWRRVLRLRTLIYVSLLVAITVAAGVSLALRNPLKVDVLRDRGALARETVPGVIENVYRLQVMNTAERAHRFIVEVEGLPGAKVVGVDQPIALDGAATRLVPLRVQVPAESARPGAHRIEFIIRSEGESPLVRREDSTFLFPR
jgi:cytochrome c oxidase accessory protein FixG